MKHSHFVAWQSYIHVRRLCYIVMCLPTVCTDTRVLHIMYTYMCMGQCSNGLWHVGWHHLCAVLEPIWYLGLGTYKCTCMTKKIYTQDSFLHPGQLSHFSKKKLPWMHVCSMPFCSGPPDFSFTCTMYIHVYMYTHTAVSMYISI